ncbi:DNA mismatch repair protein MutS2 [Monoraphidium neglectum]|uniref:DNA mismatch repair protein MutS2 n=1 Tax=Monoraphidium neglectum TaxID=145388 RepID=A0A0D2MG84_9CHLO|nr:DNA mismatch repair protein MutS2 [Monoraphidium neglectum]KIY99721.1 DNA mismatch repair protein MutS2 [Monoraphidium neglectum]|eukprot:XP_013898741.1 DNA mismatch repair protein MutS2 [Monoraphidium neglectum]
MWLDVLAAKARCGTWLGGVMPQFTPWEDVFRPRAGAAARRRAAAAAWAAGASLSSAEDEGGDAGDDGGEGEGEAGGPVVRLKGLSHPLLLANFMKSRERLHRQLRLLGADPSVGAGGQQRAARPGGGNDAQARHKRRFLSNRKDNMAAAAGSGSESEEDEEAAKVAMLRRELRGLRAPRPLDLFIQPETSAVVITGPNTGGKTATMKAFGLAALMAKTGIPVPAQSPARLPCFSSILADIGDEQSLTANLIQALRAEADGKSLLLLDELGTGTDPTEGAALGVALLRRLVRGGVGCGALTVATTHHSIMTKLKFEDPRFENASVEFDSEKLEPTYKLLWGVPGRSNALYIAERLGLDADIIAAARANLGAFASAANAAIADLEEAQGELEREEVALWAVEQEEARLERKLADMKRSLQAKRDALEQLRLDRLAAVAAAASAVAKAARDERRAARRRAGPGGAFDTEFSRKLDSALLDNLSAGPGSVLSAIEDWQRVAAAPAGAPAGAAAAGKADEWWVPAWRGLLQDARAALAAARAVGVSLDGAGGGASGAGSVGGTWEEEELAAQVDALEAAAARRAAAKAAREARRGELLARAAAMEQASQDSWAARDAASAAETLRQQRQADGRDGEAASSLLDADEDEDEDLGLGLDLRELERQEAEAAAARRRTGAQARREREQAEALSRLEAALSKVDTAAEARAMQEALDREEAQQRRAMEREAAARAERERRDAIRVASSFEQQLAELEAAAAAAESVSRDGLAGLAADQRDDRERQAQAQWQRLQEAAEGRPHAGGGVSGFDADLELPSELLELIGALEQPPADSDAVGSSRSSSSSGGGGGVTGGALSASGGGGSGYAIPSSNGSYDSGGRNHNAGSINGTGSSNGVENSGGSSSSNGNGRSSNSISQQLEPWPEAEAAQGSSGGMDAAEAALLQEMERLEQLQALLGGSGGTRIGSTAGGQGGAKRKKKRKAKSQKL